MCAWGTTRKDAFLLGPCSLGHQGCGSCRSAAFLKSRKRELANSQAARCTFFQRGLVCSRGCLAGEGSCSESSRQERLWRKFFLDPAGWWDSRQQKKSSRSPDFRHRKSQEVLWVNNFYKPHWVDAQLAALDMRMGRCATTSNCPPRPARCEGGVTPETVIELCQQRLVDKAVEAMGVLVGTGCHVSKSLFYAVLNECVAYKDLHLVQRVHVLSRKQGYESDTFLCNHILRMYGSHARLQETMDFFHMVAKPDAFTWSAIISAHVERGQHKRALDLYRRMRTSGVKPDGHVFVAALQACARGEDLRTGQQVHADVLATILEPHLVVWNCLVDMYAKCSRLDDARRVFDGVGQKDVVTWNVMIAGYAQQGVGQEAFRLYSAMQEEGLAAPDSVTFVSLLQACASVGTPALENGKHLHTTVRERGHEADLFVGNSLVNMYTKCGSLEDAQTVFDRLVQKDVITWNAMIAGYSQQGMGQEALHLYSAMQRDGTVVPNTVTFLCLLQACAHMAALDLGRQLHVQIKEQGLQGEVSLATSLINMYARSGSMADAQQVFDTLSKRDIVTWNALIAGYTYQGDGDRVFNLVQKLEEDGLKPVATTFLNVLLVCSHIGLLDKGQKYFEAMSKHYSITPTVQHYACMLDLLGRAGRLDEALALARTMLVPPDAVVWAALLGACQKWNNVEVGRRAFDEAVKLNHKDAAAYVLMSNIYAGAQMWEQVREIQERRVARGAWKQPGQSWWTDMEGLVLSFLVKDRTPPTSGSIVAYRFRMHEDVTAASYPRDRIHSQSHETDVVETRELGKMGKPGNPHFFLHVRNGTKLEYTGYASGIV